jgi:ubiquinone/menaquinone biosynthesis C-methylase UbiE
MNDNDGPTGTDKAPPSEYSDSYFLKRLGGFQEFRESGGRRIPPRFVKALRLARIRPGERVLDIGCGRGEMVIQPALLGAHGVGVDYAPDALRIALDALATHPAEVRARAAVLAMDATKLGFRDESFDVIFMNQLVEHFYPDELNAMLAETRRLLKPGGRLILNTSPNRVLYNMTYPIYIRNVHRVVCRIAELAHYQSYVIAPTLPIGPEHPRSEEERRQHVNEQTASELARTVSNCGYRVMKIEHWDDATQLPYTSRRLTIELMLLDALRSLRPFSFHWPLNKLFTNNIWVVATRP